MVIGVCEMPECDPFLALRANRKLSGNTEYNDLHTEFKRTTRTISLWPTDFRCRGRPIDTRRGYERMRAKRISIRQRCYPCTPLGRISVVRRSYSCTSTCTRTAVFLHITSQNPLEPYATRLRGLLAPDPGDPARTQPDNSEQPRVSLRSTPRHASGAYILG